MMTRLAGCTKQGKSICTTRHPEWIGLRKEEKKKEGRQEGRKEGRQEGIKEGEAAGKRHKALEIAGNMVDMNIDTDVIVKASGLSRQEVEALQRKRVTGAE